MRYNHVLSLPVAVVLLSAASGLAIASTTTPKVEPTGMGFIAIAAAPANAQGLLQLASVDRPERAHRAERPEKPEKPEKPERAHR